MPNKAFAELVGALDKMNYQLQRNPHIHLPAVWKEVETRAVEALRNKHATLRSPEPHYYFAHKWGKCLSDFLLALRKVNREAAAQLYNDFYNGTDGDRLFIIFKKLPEIGRHYGITIANFKAFDPTNDLEKRLIKDLVQEINDPRVQLGF